MKAKRTKRLIASVIIAAAVLIAVVLRLTFMIGPVRSDQLDPPPDLISFQLTSTTQTLALVPINPTAAALYKKWSPKQSTAIDWTSWPLERAPWNAPLAPDQVRWLVDHRDFIDDMIRLASAGGIPNLSFDAAAAAIRDPNFKYPPLESKYSRRIVWALCVESRRRRMIGDDAGAAECLASAYKISKSVAGPFELSLVLGRIMQTTANQELSLWIATGTMPPDIARRLRNKIAPCVITMTDYRRMSELDYVWNRDLLIKKLNGDLEDLIWYYAIFYNAPLNRNMARGDKASGSAAVEDLRAKGAGVGILMRAAIMKLTASRVVANFDAEFRRTRSAIENNLPTPSQDRETLEGHERKLMKINIAQTRLNLGALNAISGTTSTLETDPFSNTPLQKVDLTTTTIIYSVGPDYEDHKAAIAYDPTNGTFRPGDIILTIPRTK